MTRPLSVLSVLLWHIQQCKLRLSPFEQHGVAFSLVVTEGDILTVDVPVASLQLLYQGAFRDCLATQKPVWTHVAGKSCRTSASLSAEARPPAASSWFVPNIFRPAEFCDPNPRMGGVFPSASPQNISCSTPPSRKVANGRLPPARPFPLGGWSVQTRNRPPEANRALS